MQYIFDKDEKSVVRLDRGEEGLTVLKKLAEERGKSFTYSMIGACSEVELGYYDMDQKKYFPKKLSGAHIEIVALSGSVGFDGEEILVHGHGVFSNENNECSGGHVMKFIISATGEVVIDWLSEKLSKKYDEVTGLKLLSN